MQVNRIQDNTVFSAKINIIGKRFDKDFMNMLNKKAKQVGNENDVIELKYTNYKRRTEDCYNWNDCRISDSFNELTENFKARFMPEGLNKGIKKVRDKFYAEGYYDLHNQEKSAASDYIDKLVKEYAS